MTQEEHDAAKDVINEKLKTMSIELGNLTGEIMALENSPFCRASISVSSFMGLANVSINVNIPAVEVINELNEKLDPEELKKAMDGIFKEAMEQANEVSKKPDEQVEELLKQMKGKNL